jgi:hypothetical protein
MIQTRQIIKSLLHGIIAIAFVIPVYAQHSAVNLVNVDSGWAANSVNAVVFRKNSLASFKQWQYIAFYNAEKFVVIGKRKLGSSNWQLKTTSFKGNAADAHNTISIIVDGDGYLHMSWDHHNNPLNYARSIKPGSLEMSAKMSMTGLLEERVSYPEFYNLPSGDLFFLYRDGGSGKGDLVINYYHTKQKKWQQLHASLIDGEGKRNAYWQACCDNKGVIHLSWVWRESPDVASNHDMCYARSSDGGITWEKSTGEKYNLPISAVTAEYAARIQQNSELINQTSMCIRANGIPIIATYWRDQNDSIPQYHLVYMQDNEWKIINTGFRTTSFSLSGQGTKRIPISRPQVIVWDNNGKHYSGIIYRDLERNNKVSVAVSNDLLKNKWQLFDLTKFPVGSWEPTYDVGLWNQKKLLNLFVQNVDQADAEGSSSISAQMVQVLEWKPAP